MKQERPQEASTWTFNGQRMRFDPHGPWIKRTHHELWRNYALALESKLNQLTPKENQ